MDSSDNAVHSVRQKNDQLRTVKKRGTVELFLAIGLTTFLIGGGLSWLLLNRDFNAKVQDAKFLQNQLKKIEGDQPNTGANSLSSVRVAKADQGKIAETRYFSGRLVEIQKVTLASEVSGIIQTMPVEVGDYVVKDKTLIAEIDTVWLQLAINKAERELEVEEVNLKYEENEQNRLERTRSQGEGFVSESQFEQQTSAVLELRAKIALLKETLKEAKEKLSRSQIYAPFDGVIIRKIAEKGGYATIGTSLVEIVSTGELDALLMIGESFIDRVKIDDDIPIFVDSLNNLEVNGKVTSIVSYGPSAARAFPVRIRMNDQEGRLKIGMSVRGRIKVSDEREAILVPSDAVIEKPDGATVWIVLEKKNGDEIQQTVYPIPVRVVAKTDGVWGVEQIFLTEQTKKSSSSKNQGNSDNQNLNNQNNPENQLASLESASSESGGSDTDSSKIGTSTTESSEDEPILNAGSKTVIEGAERLMIGMPVRIVGVNPDHLKNLPKGNGQMLFEPASDNNQTPDNTTSNNQTLNDSASENIPSERVLTSDILPSESGSLQENGEVQKNTSPVSPLENGGGQQQ